MWILEGDPPLPHSQGGELGQQGETPGSPQVDPPWRGGSQGDSGSHRAINQVQTSVSAVLQGADTRNHQRLQELQQYF